MSPVAKTSLKIVATVLLLVLSEPIADGFVHLAPWAGPADYYRGYWSAWAVLMLWPGLVGLSWSVRPCA